ncbi:Hypothetical protein NTJ_06327 [Nesidiocoris tenuis]|uniref:Uncharacterized protein n=1 Tax=Nesidiocoris tenuis TaxID=355587 RepID=A0ABN7ANI4_9HEMI|nr:Hypothetical protein NTJ_06327 [Nesidiocoris tenuis]
MEVKPPFGNDPAESRQLIEDDIGRVPFISQMGKRRWERRRKERREWGCDKMVICQPTYGPLLYSGSFLPSRANSTLPFGTHLDLERDGLVTTRARRA